MTLDANQQAQQAAARLQEDIQQADAQTLRLLFTDARSHNGWQDRPVSDTQLQALYDLLKWGPTSANSSPARFYFIRTPAAKEQLKPALSEGNAEKTMAAPVTAIIAYDVEFWRELPKLFPHKDMTGPFKNNPTAAQTAAFRNGTLQGAYFIIAARAIGLDCGPMSGFNNALVDDTFFKNTTLKSNFLCNLGYADTSKIFVRSPRLDFSEACRLL